jgi:hypothetical protein
MNPHTSKGVSTLGIRVQVDFQIFRKRLQGSKLNGLRSSLYHWKDLGTYMSKMGSHDPFRYLKHKLWPKEKPKVKLLIWFRTTKVRNHPDFLTCRWRATYHWKALNEGYNFALDFMSIRGLHAKFMGPQSHGSPRCENFETPTWESRKKMPFGCGPRGTKYTIRGKVMASPKSGLWWVLWIRICPWLVLAPKVLQLCTNQLVVWFCAGPCEWLSACHSS